MQEWYAYPFQTDRLGQRGVSVQSRLTESAVRQARIATERNAPARAFSERTT